MNLSQQALSAGAESIGTFAKLANEASDLRTAVRNTIGTACKIQSDATLQDGLAQQHAMEDEANIRGTAGIQSFVEAGSTATSEVVGWGIEHYKNTTTEAQLSQTNLKRAENWESKMKHMEPVTPMAMLNADGTPGEPVKVPAPKMNLDEMKEHISKIRITDKEGNIIDFDELKDQNKPAYNALQQALTSSDPEMKEFAGECLKEARDAVKKFRKETESISGSAQRSSELSKGLVRASGIAIKGGFDFWENKALQEDEAKEKFLETQERYVADASGAFMRQGDSVAANMTQHAQNIQQAQKEMFESNRA